MTSDEQLPQSIRNTIGDALCTVWERATPGSKDERDVDAALAWLNAEWEPVEMQARINQLERLLDEAEALQISKNSKALRKPIVPIIHPKRKLC